MTKVVILVGVDDNSDGGGEVILVGYFENNCFNVLKMK